MAVLIRENPIFSWRFYLALLCLSLNLNFPAARAGESNMTAKYNALSAGRKLIRDPEVSQAPELPQLPLYPSNKIKFFGGHTQSSGNGWITYRCNYLLKEKPGEVKSWYENALKPGWQILHIGPQSITARHKDGHACTLIVNEASKSTGYGTRLFVTYSQAPPRSVENH